jgi:predicted PolB exonuclease-like 3'-5' exonuclease
MIYEAYEILGRGHITTLITFNGIQFDLPFLRMRGFKYGLDFGDHLPYQRYSVNHYDIFDKIGGKWGDTATLEELAWYFNVQGLLGSGADVKQLWAEGRVDTISSHCGGDLTVTEGIYDVMTGGLRPF